MRALVTGGAGFIGSHIVDALVRDGADVLVIDDLSRGNTDLVNPAARLVVLDIAGDELDQAVRAFRPEIVFHEAAQASVPVSLQHPDADARTNIMGTLKLLQASVAAGVRKVIYASSAAVYGTPRCLPIDEDHPVNPLSPYGVSKLTVESYLSVFRHNWGLDFTALRYANVYGPRQDTLGEGGVVAIFSDLIRRGQPLTVFGDGEQTRDFVHVYDVVSANLAAISRGGGSIVNIGTARATTVNELIGAMEKNLGSRLQVNYQGERQGDIRHSFLTNEKARLELAWEPRYDLAAGLAETLGATGSA